MARNRSSLARRASSIFFRSVRSCHTTSSTVRPCSSVGVRVTSHGKSSPSARRCVQSNRWYPSRRAVASISTHFSIDRRPHGWNSGDSTAGCNASTSPLSWYRSMATAAALQSRMPSVSSKIRWRVGRRLEQHAERLVLFQFHLGGEQLPPQDELRHHLPGEHPQGVRLGGGEGAGGRVDDAQGAQGVPVGGDERGTGVEADPRPAGDERVVGEPPVGGGVGHHQQVGLGDGVGAEGDVAGGLGGVEAVPRLEPLAAVVDQADEGDGRVAHGRGQAGQVVELGFGRGVEEGVLAEGGQPVGFVRDGGCVHRRSRLRSPATAPHRKGRETGSSDRAESQRGGLRCGRNCSARAALPGRG